MKFDVTMGLHVLLLHLLCQFGIISADGSNMRWGVWPAGQILLLHLLPQLAASGSECTQAQMVSILGRQAGEASCQPTATIVPVEVGDGDQLVLAPSHIEVKRCQGSCPLAALSCLPATVKQVPVSALLSPPTFSIGQAQPVCHTAQVEEHTSCHCGCPIGPEDCPSSDKHYFLPYECRCACRREEGRASCLARGWLWDSGSCECICPGRPYPHCPTQYVFDYQASCSCVPIHAGAFSQLEVGLVLLAASCLLIVVSLVQCYRKGIGLFRHQRVGGGSRQSQLRQDVDSLITKFDRIRMKKIVAEESPEDSDPLTRQTRGNSL